MGERLPTTVAEKLVSWSMLSISTGTLFLVFLILYLYLTGMYRWGFYSYSFTFLHPSDTYSSIDARHLSHTDHFLCSQTCAQTVLVHDLSPFFCGLQHKLVNLCSDIHYVSY